MRVEWVLQFFLVFFEYLRFLLTYFHKKILVSSLYFEKYKNILVKFFMMKRGRYNRTFLHGTAMVVMGIGVMVAPFLAETYPILANRSASAQVKSTSEESQSIIPDSNVFQTEVSEKPRDKIITYKVEPGDTISSIAKKFSSSNNVISEDTIRWANDLTNDDITAGDELKILPVTGISHKVESGDTVYSIAKKYDANAQAIVDFPFNEFANPETFSLVTGQFLIVPDGVKPQEIPVYKAKPQQYYAKSYTGQVPVAGGSWFFPMPSNTGISQYPAWYHMAIDITAPIGTPVYAAHSGTVSDVLVGTWDGGYGTNIYIDNGDGVKTHYAHLNSIIVSAGQQVVGGKTVIGYSGSTGRSTGAHTHFEVIVNGVLVNPLGYVQ